MPAGFSTLEGMLCVALIGIVAVPFAGAIVASSEAVATQSFRARALARANEGVEAVRNIKEHAFDDLQDGVWGLTLANNTWTLSNIPDTAEGLTRTITIVSVDPSIKMIESSVAWKQTPQRMASTTIATMMSDWLSEKNQNKSDKKK